MSIFSKKIEPFLYRKNNLIYQVAFTAVFALLFINIYQPFSSKDWYPGISNFEYIGYSSIIILTGVLVVLISRILMYYYTKKRELTYLQYGLWILAEILAMSLFYAFYTYFVNETKDFFEIYEESLVNTILVILLPYLISTLYFSLQEKSRRLKELEESDDSGELRGKHEIISFLDEKGEMKLSVKKENLLYIESADNYIIVWHLGNKGIEKYMIRDTLKSLEGRLEKHNILRCHRSYMVNMDQVKVVKRAKGGIYLELGVDNVPEIPASKSYSEKISAWFKKFS